MKVDLGQVFLYVLKQLISWFVILSFFPVKTTFPDGVLQYYSVASTVSLTQ